MVPPLQDLEGGATAGGRDPFIHVRLVVANSPRKGGGGVTPARIGPLTREEVAHKLGLEELDARIAEAVAKCASSPILTTDLCPGYFCIV